MRFRYTILLITVAATIAGCNMSEVRWPWEKEKEIPLTEPLAVGDETERDIATAPQPETYVTAKVDEKPSDSEGVSTASDTTAGTTAGFEEPILLQDLASESAPAVKPPQVESTRAVVSGEKPTPPVKPQTVEVSKTEILAESKKEEAPTTKEETPSTQETRVESKVDDRLKPSVIEEPPVVEKQPPVIETRPDTGTKPQITPDKETPKPEVPEEKPEELIKTPDKSEPPVVVEEPDKGPLVKVAPETPVVKPEEPAETTPDTQPKPETPEDSGSTELVAGSVLQVNDKYITVKEIMQVIRPKLAELPKGLPEKAFRMRANEVLQKELHFKIDNILVLAEAQKSLTDAQNEVLDKEMEALRERMIASAGGSKTKLEADLAKDGVTLEEYLKGQREQMVVHAYLHDRFYKAIEIKPKDLRAYYNKHKADFTMAKEVQMQIVAAPFQSFLPEDMGSKPTELELKAAKAKAKELITQAQEAIKSGEEFDSVAKRLSRGIKAETGGYWPMMPAGSFREKKVEEAAFQLEQEQVSDIIETDSGYYIVKAVRVKPGKLVSFKDAQSVIADTLRQQEFNELVAKYYRRLYEGATILQSAQFEKTVLDLMVAEYYGK